MLDDMTWAAVMDALSRANFAIVPKDAGEWLSMESAPRDGSEILAIGGVCHGRPFVCSWKPSRTDPPMPWMNPITGSSLYEHALTHWQALPSPPAAASETG